MSLILRILGRLGDIHDLGLFIFLKTVFFLVFALFCYGGILILYEWAIGEGLDSTSQLTDPIFRWTSAAVILSIFLVSVGYVLYTRIRRVDLLIKILQPIPLPQRYTRRIQDAVEGISIASGIESPEILFLKVDCLNAFTLSQPGGIYLFLTRGLLTSLDKEELTAVVAHEFAHIKLHHLRREFLHGGVYWKLVRLEARKREWLRLIVVLLPILLCIAVICGVTVLAFNEPEVGGLLVAIASFLIAIPFLPLFIDFRMRYAFPRRDARNNGSSLYCEDIEADRLALSWTFFPEGMARAMRKCYGRSCSPMLVSFNDISFASTFKFRGCDYQHKERLQSLEESLR